MVGYQVPGLHDSQKARNFPPPNPIPLLHLRWPSLMPWCYRLGGFLGIQQKHPNGSKGGHVFLKHWELGSMDIWYIIEICMSAKSLDLLLLGQFFILVPSQKTFSHVNLCIRYTYINNYIWSFFEFWYRIRWTSHFSFSALLKLMRNMEKRLSQDNMVLHFLPKSWKWKMAVFER